MNDLASDHPLMRVFHQLRRRGFLLGPDDLVALYRLLGEGFGWGSRIALRDLCRALWAKSRTEQRVLDSVFEQFWTASWDVTEAAANAGKTGAAESAPTIDAVAGGASVARGSMQAPAAPEVVLVPGRLPPVPSPESLSVVPFVLVPQYPVSPRGAALVWRRLRRPVRFGPAVELDLGATILRRASTGVATPPVLRPLRRNTARLVLLIDREGSMAPFDDAVAEVAGAIRQSAQLAGATAFYFHDVPAEGTNDAALVRLPRDTVSPAVDDVVADLAPARHGWLHLDPELLQPVPLATVLDSCRDHAVAVFSDAGAARGRYDVFRILDSLALVRALRKVGATIVWINPLPRMWWSSTSAGEIARHVAMFPFDREGLHQAVNHLRGQPAVIEQAV
jgi:uncharacterized protein with von Willebrand factor type A (vWA) domain